ncbi:hypothetical protein DEJ51_05170 [Streptomyces venezuelae]|uniref:Uncharacterized protein n=2 Tax=Streptomyces venezuelae TaxID=54571 RepID=A0A5P2DGK3_STRVZ|nr:hypothetical protein DEJ51_05170 [Streptomyces venezuelae]
MSEQNRTVPRWFRGGPELHQSLLDLTAWHPEATEIATSPRAPDDFATDTMLEFLSQELMRSGYADDWSVTSHGQEIEDLIDVFHRIAQRRWPAAG